MNSLNAISKYDFYGMYSMHIMKLIVNIYIKLNTNKANSLSVHATSVNAPKSYNHFPRKIYPNTDNIAHIIGTMIRY